MLLGGGGVDVIDGGDGDDIEIQSLNATSQRASSDRVISARTADAEWVADHVRIENGSTVIELDGKAHELSTTDLSHLADQATAELTAAAQATTTQPSAG